MQRIKYKNKELERIKKLITPILKKYGIKKAGIFGSYARGDYSKNSDIDILVKLPRGIGLEFIGIELELEEKLGKKVHLVTYKYVHPYIKKNIFSEEISVI